MQIMPTRQTEIEKTFDGLNATNVPLVAMDRSGFHPAGNADSEGMFYFVSHIAKFFHFSTNTALDIFLFFLLALGASIAIGCFFFLFKSWISRFISSVGCLLLTKLAYNLSDVYIAYFFAVSTTVPLFILMKNRHHNAKWLWIGSLAFSGIVIGYSNFIRDYAGTAVLIFLVLWIACDQVLNKKEKTIYMCLLCVFSLIPYAHEKTLLKQRDIFFKQHQELVAYQHLTFPTWHLFYIGLGYLENDYGILRKDESAMEKVKSINPKVTYLSKECNRSVKNEYFSIMKSDPWFVLKSYIVKLLVSCWLALKYANIGLLFYFYVRPSWREVLPFCVAALFGILPGIVTAPFDKYLLGMISLATLFGVYMIGMGIEKYRKTSRIIAQHQKL
jgi:hypothetical protein